jgi:hypothetical protein
VCHPHEARHDRNGSDGKAMNSGHVSQPRPPGDASQDTSGRWYRLAANGCFLPVDSARQRPSSRSARER